MNIEQQRQQRSTRESDFTDRITSLQLVDRVTTNLGDEPQQTDVNSAAERTAQEHEAILFRPRLRYVDEE